jgi:hypothetical protein
MKKLSLIILTLIVNGYAPLDLRGKEPGLYLDVVDVAALATKGDGSPSNPYTGWATLTPAPETEYYFRAGKTFSYDHSPNWLVTGVVVRGGAGTILKHLGAGNAFVMDNPGAHEGPTSIRWTHNVRVENLIIQGNAQTTNGMFLRGIRNGLFKHISIRDVSEAAIYTEALVTNVFENVRCLGQETEKWLKVGRDYNVVSRVKVVPKYGMVLGSRDSYDWTTTTTVINPVFEGVSVAGIWVQNGPMNNTFINGTCENNGGKGMQIDGRYNVFENMDFEANRGHDINIIDCGNQLINCFSTGTVAMSAGGLQTIFLGGHYNRITADVSARFTTLIGATFTTFTDDSKTAILVGTIDKSGLRHDSFLGNYIPRVAALPFASTVNIPFASNVNTDARKSSIFNVGPLTSSFTLANPTNPTDGQTITWRFQQDAIGGRTITYGSQFRALPGRSLPALSTAPQACDYIVATYNAGSEKWDVQNGGSGGYNPEPEYTSLAADESGNITWTFTPSTKVQNTTTILTKAKNKLALIGLTSGAHGRLIVRQDGIGGRSITLPPNSIVEGGGSGTVALTPAPDSVDVLTFTYDGTNLLWERHENFH